MENNVALTGNQARLLIQIMTNSDVTYKGSILPEIYMIFGQLVAISNAQPPVGPPPPSSP